jgi:hypothetical protein
VTEKPWAEVKLERVEDAAMRYTELSITTTVRRPHLEQAMVDGGWYWEDLAATLVQAAIAILTENAVRRRIVDRLENGEMGVLAEDSRVVEEVTP